MNYEIKNVETEVLFDNWGKLKRVTYDYSTGNGKWETQTREIYDRGNGAAVLLYNKELQNIILTRQFRIPTYLNGNKTGMLIEVCAGLLDDESPEEGIKRETEEETGYKIGTIKKVFETYMSPGSVTEILYLFIAAYSSDMKVNDGGGVAHEHENIEVMEINFQKAISMVESGEIKDAKTIMLLQYVQLQNIM